MEMFYYFFQMDTLTKCVFGVLVFLLASNVFLIKKTYGVFNGFYRVVKFFLKVNILLIVSLRCYMDYQGIGFYLLSSEAVQNWLPSKGTPLNAFLGDDFSFAFNGLYYAFNYLGLYALVKLIGYVVCQLDQNQKAKAHHQASVDIKNN